MIARLLSSVYLAVRELAVPRSRAWPLVRRTHLRLEPACQWCGTRDDAEVHHIVPVHVDSTRELDPANLITLCMADGKCHYRRGHRGQSWLAYDPAIRAECNRRKEL